MLYQLTQVTEDVKVDWKGAGYYVLVGDQYIKASELTPEQNAKYTETDYVVIELLAK